MTCMKRRDFLHFLPVCALSLAACDAGQKQASALQVSLEPIGDYALQYAKQFTVKDYADGCALVTIAGSEHYFVVPEGAHLPEIVPEDAVVLQQPLDRCYLVSSSVMDMIVQLDALDDIALSGTKADGWYIPQARLAMEEGKILYAGKYSAPDYERILASDCNFCIQNTMVLHTPEVKEELEKFGIPVLVERSSYESGPLARMEWIKLYGVLFNCREKAEAVFNEKLAQIDSFLRQASTGKTAAFFSVTSNNLITVRKGGDYVAQMISMAGGTYVFANLADNGNNLATMNITQELFYAGAKDADVLFYNSTIEGAVSTTEQLLGKCPILKDFKAVQDKNVWCTSQSMFQQSMELCELMSDMHRVFVEQMPANLNYLIRVE